MASKQPLQLGYWLPIWPLSCIVVGLPAGYMVTGISLKNIQEHKEKLRSLRSASEFVQHHFHSMLFVKGITRLTQFPKGGVHDTFPDWKSIEFPADC